MVPTEGQKRSEPRLLALGTEGFSKEGLSLSEASRVVSQLWQVEATGTMRDVVVNRVGNEWDQEYVAPHRLSNVFMRDPLRAFEDERGQRLTRGFAFLAERLADFDFLKLLADNERVLELISPDTRKIPAKELSPLLKQTAKTFAVELPDQLRFFCWLYESQCLVGCLAINRLEVFRGKSEKTEILGDGRGRLLANIRLMRSQEFGERASSVAGNLRTIYSNPVFYNPLLSLGIDFIGRGFVIGDFPRVYLRQDDFAARAPLTEEQVLSLRETASGLMRGLKRGILPIKQQIVEQE